ncbi:MAG: hypothetical protein Q9162_004336 [Coniocarpon cinnabarinum]
MSSGQVPGYENTDPNTIAKQAEQDLNSYEAKQGHHGPGHAGVGASDTTADSGIDARAAARFPGGTVQYGSAASGAGNNRDIPPEEGGGINPETGRTTKAGDFEGIGGPEDKMGAREVARPGDQDVQGNVRQGTETRRP